MTAERTRPTWDELRALTAAQATPDKQKGTRERRKKGQSPEQLVTERMIARVTLRQDTAAEQVCLGLWGRPEKIAIVPQARVVYAELIATHPLLDVRASEFINRYDRYDAALFSDGSSVIYSFLAGCWTPDGLDMIVQGLRLDARTIRYSEQTQKWDLLYGTTAGWHEIPASCTDTRTHPKRCSCFPAKQPSEFSFEDLSTWG